MKETTEGQPARKPKADICYPLAYKVEQGEMSLIVYKKRIQRQGYEPQARKLHSPI